MRVKDIMAAEVRTLDRNDSLSVADDLMASEHIRHFPVVDKRMKGRLVGIVSQRDLLHAALSSAMGFGAKASKKFLESVPIKEIMTEEVVTTTPAEDIRVAARVMLEKKIGCLPVLDGETLVGILSESDLLQVVADS